MNNLKTLINQTLPLVIFIVFALIVLPIEHTSSLDTDEGINLMKSLLYLKGFSLYTEIWSDQPPIFTILLARWLEWFSYSIQSARILVLAFSGIFIWCFYQILKTFRGNILAITGTLIFIFLSKLFLRLSISIMIGLPSLSIGLLSLYILNFCSYSDKRTRKIFLLISASLISISLQIKLTSILLMPVAATYFIYHAYLSKNIKKKQLMIFILSDALLYLFSALIIYITLGLILGSLNYEQLWISHNVSKSLNYDNDWAGLHSQNLFDFYIVLRIWFEHKELSILTVMGLLSVIRKRCVEAIIPLAWLATSTLFLALHFPVWYHHHIFALAPMSWLASYSILLIIDFFSKSNWFEQIRKIKLQLILPPLVSGILLIYGFLEIPALIPRFSNDRQEFIAINILKNHEQIEPWVFVDKPILAFRANLLVPPELAVLSIKRFASGNISFQDIPAILEKYKPDQILLSRFAKQALGDSTFSEYLRNNYVQLDLDIDLKKKDHFIYYIREST